jgi:hypothetical protein
VDRVIGLTTDATMMSKENHMTMTAPTTEPGARDTNAVGVDPTDNLPGRVIGLYIDMSRATSFAGTRLCLVRTMPDGSLQVDALESTDERPYPEPPAGMPVPHLTAADLAAVVDAVWH